jgi:carbonic anhydrase
MLGTIEYGAEHLGSSLVVVMGHQHCGAVTAACNMVQKGEKPGGFIGKLVSKITPAAEVMMGKAGDFVANTVLENARRNAETILTASEVVKNLVTVGKLKVIYATYDIDTGVVEFYG